MRVRGEVTPQKLGPCRRPSRLCLALSFVLPLYHIHHTPRTLVCLRGGVPSRRLGASGGTEICLIDLWIQPCVWHLAILLTKQTTPKHFWVPGLR